MAFPTISLLAYLGYDPFDAAAVGTELASRLYAAEWSYGQFNEGRGYEGLAATVYLDNGDGAFNKFNVASPYYSNVKPAVRMQLKLAGVAVFTGYVRDWPFTPLADPTVPEGMAKIELIDALTTSSKLRVELSNFRDSFDRADQAGLGVADEGGTWELVTPAAFSIAGNQAYVTPNAGGYFYDSFSISTPAAPLPNADTGQAWTTNLGSFLTAYAGDYGATSQGPPIGVRAAGGGGDSIATVDTLQANGTLLVGMEDALPAMSGRAIFRFTDTSNYWYVEWFRDRPTPYYTSYYDPTAGESTIKVAKVVAGVETNLYTATSQPPAPGVMVIWVVMNGSAIEVRRGQVGATTVMTNITDSFNATATRHGIGYAYNASYPICAPFTSITLDTTAIATTNAIAVLDTGSNVGYARITMAELTNRPQNFGPALILRYTDASNYMFVTREGDNNTFYGLHLWSVVAGVATNIQSMTLAGNAGLGGVFFGDIWTVRVEENGGQHEITAYLSYWRRHDAGLPTQYDQFESVSTGPYPFIATAHNNATKWGFGYIQGASYQATGIGRYDDFLFWQGLPKERTDSRVGRLLDAINFPGAWRSLAVGRFVVPPQVNFTDSALDDSAPLSDFQLLADSEFGAFYLDHRGFAIFETNLTRSNWPGGLDITGAFGTLTAGKVPVSAWTFNSGEEFIRTEVTVDGIPLSRKVDRVAERQFGSRSGFWSTAISQQLAGYPENTGYFFILADLFLARYAHQIPRCTSITVDWAASSTAASQVLARRIRDRITVDVPAIENGAMQTFDCFIEGVKGRLSLDPAGQSLNVTFGLAPIIIGTTGAIGYFILDDAVFGVLGSAVLG